MSDLLESVLVLVEMFGQRTIIIIILIMIAYIHFRYNRKQFVHELDKALERLSNFKTFALFWQAILVLMFYKVKT